MPKAKTRAAARLFVERLPLAADEARRHGLLKTYRALAKAIRIAHLEIANQVARSEGQR